MSDTLFLPLKAKWYELIEKGIKKEEYREIKEYWIKRFIRKECLTHFLVDKYDFKEFDKVVFSLGYTHKTMTFEIENFSIGTGKPEWGAEPNQKYFVIKLGRRLK